MRVFQTFQHLPADCQPGLAVRQPGATLVAIDPRATRRQAVQWAVDHLTQQERDVMRAAWGVPACGDYCPDWWLEDVPVSQWVPPGLRLRSYVDPVLRPRAEYRTG